nr:hypothetical protein [Pseudodesulfovibrio tunisiensis]
MTRFMETVSPRISSGRQWISTLENRSRAASAMARLSVLMMMASTHSHASRALVT